MTSSTVVKTRDELYPFTGFWASAGVCRIRVFEIAGRPPVVVATEIPENESTSVTNVAEYLAAEVITRYFPQRFEEAEPVIWLEHYARTTGGPLRPRPAGMSNVDRVTFSRWSPRPVVSQGVKRVTLGEPSWAPISREELERLIGPSSLDD